MFEQDWFARQATARSWIWDTESRGKARAAGPEPQPARRRHPRDARHRRHSPASSGGCGAFHDRPIRFSRRRVARMSGNEVSQDLHDRRRIVVGGDPGITGHEVVFLKSVEFSIKLYATKKIAFSASSTCTTATFSQKNQVSTSILRFLASLVRRAMSVVIKAVNCWAASPWTQSPRP